MPALAAPAHKQHWTTAEDEKRDDGDPIKPGIRIQKDSFFLTAVVGLPKAPYRRNTLHGFARTDAETRLLAQP